MRGTCLFVLGVAKACTPGDYTGSWPNNQYCCPDGAFRSACCGEGFLDPSAAVNGVLTINADVPENAYLLEQPDDNLRPRNAHWRHLSPARTRLK